MPIYINNTMLSEWYNAARCCVPCRLIYGVLGIIVLLHGPTASRLKLLVGLVVDEILTVFLVIALSTLWIFFSQCS